MAETPARRERRRSERKVPDLFAAYLARSPESNPRLLLPRSVPPLVRGAYLLHGVLVRDWSLAWLAGFFAAEFLLTMRFAVLGDRWSAAPQYDPELHRRTSVVAQLFWLVATVAAFLFTGYELERSTGGEAFGSGSGAVAATPGVGTAFYLLVLLGEFLFDLFAARREKRPFVSAGTLQASIFFVLVLLLTFVGVFASGVVDGLFGEAGARGLAAILLVVARNGSDLAVLWMPLWFPWLAARRRTKAT